MLTVPLMGEHFGKAIREARKSRGLTLVELARQVGVSYPAVQQWETGKTEPSTENLLKICQLLDIDPLTLTVGRIEQQGYKVASMPEDSGRHLPPKPDVDLSKTEDIPNFRGFGGPRDVPVRGTALGGSEEDGDFRFTADANLGHEPRPPGIMGKKDIYVVYVQNDSMDPKFEPGDRLYVDPHRPPRTMDYVVVELHGEDGESGRGYIKRLLRKTPTRVVLEQFNPRKELEFSVDEVKALHRVIPQDELLGV